MRIEDWEPFVIVGQLPAGCTVRNGNTSAVPIDEVAVIPIGRVDRGGQDYSFPQYFERRSLAAPSDRDQSRVEQERDEGQDAQHVGGNHAIIAETSPRASRFPDTGAC